MKRVIYSIIILIAIFKINIVVNADSYCKYNSKDTCKSRPDPDGDLMCEWYEKDGKGECRVKCSNYSKNSCNGYTVCKWNAVGMGKYVCEYVGAGNGSTPPTNKKACSERTKKSECEDGTGGCEWNSQNNYCKKSCYLVTTEAECRKDTSCEWDSNYSYKCHPACSSNTSESDCKQSYCEWNKTSKKCVKRSKTNENPSDGGSSSRSDNEDGTISDAEDCSDNSGRKAIKFQDNEYCYKENEGVYCSKDSGDKLPECFLVNKNSKLYDDYLGIYGFPIGEYAVQNAFGTVGTTTGIFLTTENDPIVNSYGLWWGSANLCYVWEPHIFSSTKYSLFAYTDSLAAIKGDTSWLNDSDCKIYEPQNIDPANKIAYCSKINDREDKIHSLATQYKSDPKPSIVSKYKILVSEIEDMCAIVLQNSDYNDACVSKCLKLSENVKEWDDEFGTSTGETKCGFSMRLISWVINIVKWIKFIIPVAVIILGILDFIKATSSDKDDEMKKAQGNFVKRLIAAALIFLIPLLVEFILPKLGFDYNSCGIF